MRILILFLILLISGCTIIDTPARPGVMYHYSGFTEFECSKCHNKTNLYRLDKKDRVVCKACYKKSKKKHLYH